MNFSPTKTEFLNFLRYGYVSIWNHFLCYIPSYALRKYILVNLFRARIGKSNIHMGVQFFSPWKLVVGDGSNLQYGSFLDCRGGLYIGNNVDITIGVKILTQDHDVRSKTYLTRSRCVTIEENVVVGSFALILPGASLKKNSVLGSGSVLTKVVPEGEIWAGNPAAFIGGRGSGLEYTCSYRRPFH